MRDWGAVKSSQGPSSQDSYTPSCASRLRRPRVQTSSPGCCAHDIAPEELYSRRADLRKDYPRLLLNSPGGFHKLAGSPPTTHAQTPLMPEDGRGWLLSSRWLTAIMKRLRTTQNRSRGHNQSDDGSESCWDLIVAPRAARGQW